MKRLLSLAVIGLAFAFGTAFAQDKPATAQQGKMATCNKDAEGKKGDERKTFMKECLSAKKELPQQSKMKSCNVEAKGKKGDERKAFMKECLSKAA